MFGITFIYALLTFFIWRANKKSVDEMKLTRELAYRPEVIAFFYEKHGGLYFQIKNIGSRVAFNTKVRIDPVFNIFTYTAENNFMTVHAEQGRPTYEEKNIKVLAPNQSLETFVGVENEILNYYYKSVETNERNKDSLESTIELIYYSYNKDKKYQEKYDVTLLDYQKHGGIIIKDIHHGVKELEKMNRNLSEIKTELKQSNRSLDNKNNIF